MTYRNPNSFFLPYLVDRNVLCEKLLCFWCKICAKNTHQLRLQIPYPSLLLRCVSTYRASSIYYTEGNTLLILRLHYSNVRLLRTLMPAPKGKAGTQKETVPKLAPAKTRAKSECKLAITGLSYKSILHEHLNIKEGKKSKTSKDIEYIETPNTIQKNEAPEKMRAEYFLDSKKNRVKTWSTMMDRTTNDILPLYTNKPCRNCHHTYETHPLGCPIKYIPHHSDSNDPKRKKIEGFLKANNFPCSSTDYFETECMFCSFPCIKSYIMSKLSITPSSYMYTNALTHLSLMYKKLFSLKTLPTIPSAHDIETLSSYGGHLSIMEYRNTMGLLQFDKFVNVKRPMMFASFSHMEETASHTEKDYL